MSRDGDDEPGRPGDARGDDRGTTRDDEAVWSDEAAWDDRTRAAPARPGTDGRRTTGSRGGARAGDGRAGGSDHWVDTLREQQYEPHREPSRRRSGFDPTLFDAGVATFAFRYPFEREAKTALATAGLVLFAVLVVPGVLAAGYLTRLAGAAARAEETPGYGDVSGLFVLGAVASLFAVAAVGGLTLLVFVTADTSRWLSAALALAGAYLLPGLFATYAATEDPREAVRRTPEFAFTMRYLTQFVVSGTLTFVGGGLVFFLLALVPFGLFVVPLFAGFLPAYWGYIYGEALEAGDVRPLPADGP